MPQTVPAVPQGASIRKEIAITASAAAVWDALADFHAVHVRVAPGFLISSTPESEGVRIVDFANGSTAREVLVSSDPAARRLVYAIPAEPFVSYSATVQVFEAGAGESRLVWAVDMVPAAIADYVAGQMDVALPMMQRALAGTRAE